MESIGWAALELPKAAHPMLFLHFDELYRAAANDH